MFTMFNALRRLLRLFWMGQRFQHLQGLATAMSPPQATWEDLSALANEMGVTFADYHTADHNGGWLHGTYHDVTISVQDQATLHSSRHGSYMTYSTLFEVFLGEEHSRDGLRVTRNNFNSKVSKFLGSEAFPIGDDAFDNAFIIRAPSEHAANSFFSSKDVRQRFLILQKMCSKFHYLDGILTLEYAHSIFEDHHKIRDRVNALVLCAHAIMSRDQTMVQEPEPSNALLETAPPAVLEQPQILPEPEEFNIQW